MTNLLTKTAHYLWLHGWKYAANERQHARLVAQLKGKTPVRVVFMALDVSMWRYQRLYELMAADSRFQVSIVLSPCPLREQPDADAEGLRRYFGERGIPYVDYHPGAQPFDIRGELQPDIIFYTQPYEYLLAPEHDCRAFYDRLVCYIPYGFNTFAKWAYNLHFCNRAWRLYYAIDDMRQTARRTAWNHGRNVRVAGYANADDYLSARHAQPWKPVADGRPRKRIIWAPHFTITSISKTVPPRSNFLWMADLMLQLARDYADRLQLAFKPHPALLTQLYKHADWGKERADAYYAQWDALANTQLETGSYTDLFMTSDAMIHDSASFTVEYHYSRQPAMFVARHPEQITAGQTAVGRRAFDLHYLGATEADVRRFVDDVVLAGNDPLRPGREAFFADYLLPPNGKSVAQNVLDDIVASLHL